MMSAESEGNVNDVHLQNRQDPPPPPPRFDFWGIFDFLHHGTDPLRLDR